MPREADPILLLMTLADQLNRWLGTLVHTSQLVFTASYARIVKQLQLRHLSPLTRTNVEVGVHLILDMITLFKSAITLQHGLMQGFLVRLVDLEVTD